MLTVADKMDQLQHVLEDRCGVPVTVGPPQQDAEDGVCLLALSVLRGGRTDGAPNVLSLNLRVLAVPVGPTSLDTLEHILITLEREPGFHCESDDISSQLWLALGITPRPSVVVGAPVLAELSEPAVPRVGQGLVVTMHTTRVLNGTVLGPGGYPLSGAAVLVGHSDVAVNTDPRGRFRTIVSAETALHPVRIQVRNQVMKAEIEADPSSSDLSVVIRCERLEL